MSTNLVNSIEPIKFHFILSYDYFTVRTLTEYNSEHITPPGKSSPKFFFRMLPNSNSCVYLYLHLLDPPKAVPVEVNISILDSQGLMQKPYLTQKDLNLGQLNIYYGLRSEILKRFLKDDTLKFHCEVFVNLQVYC